MPHRFTVRIGDQIHTYQRYEDIPAEFDHVIEFLPELPPPPHTDQQHREIEAWQPRFEQLMEKERARSSKTR
jgi:hypothetical protein